MDKEKFAVYKKYYTFDFGNKITKLAGPFETRKEAQIKALSLGIPCYIENVDRNRYLEIIENLWEKYVSYRTSTSSTTSRTTSSTTSGITINGYYVPLYDTNQWYGPIVEEPKSSLFDDADKRINTKLEFINELKTNYSFGKKWEILIEERKLSIEDRVELGWRHHVEGMEEQYKLTLDECKTKKDTHMVCNGFMIPTKSFTIIYKKEIIEIYEYE
jgi:hypothetical protein